MSVTNWFETFNNNIQISNTTVEKIAYRYKRMTKQLNKDFWNTDSDIYHSLYVGSYGRDTDIHVSDIDMLFHLPYSIYEKYNAYTNNGQSSLLQAVKASIEKTYSSSMKADGQVIVISFDDGIIFELVPAFVNKDYSYTFPDSNNGGSWRVTNPKPEIAEINKKNNEWNKNLKRLARMAKAWKDTWNVPMGGLLIDTMAYNFMSGWTYKDKSYLYYDFMSRDFFKYLSEQNDQQAYWLSPGAKQYVWRKGNFASKAKQCYNIALEAIEKEKTYPTTAKAKWREIYGTQFLPEQYELLEAQLRENYGKIVYSHKTQEKCADILTCRNNRVKNIQIILSALVTTGLLVRVFKGSEWALILSTILSAIQFALTSFLKEYNLGETIQKHNTAALELWDIREQYLSLLTDLKARLILISDASMKRDELHELLSKTYKGSPRTFGKAYSVAQKALQDNEELTFSNKEIDNFLPNTLRKNQP